MLPEYDFSKGVRGKHAKQYRQGTNIVILEKDVAAMFPTSQDVNKALRALVPIIRSIPIPPELTRRVHPNRPVGRSPDHLVDLAPHSTS